MVARLWPPYLLLGDLMQIALNEHSRTLMVFIGEPSPKGIYPISFTLDDPGPKDIDLDALGPREKTQLLYNYRRGTLLVENKEDFLKATEGTPAAAKNWATGVERPIERDKPPKDALQQEEDVKSKLRTYLKQHWATIKKNIPNLDLVTLRQLIELEEVGKGRKALLKALNEAVDDYTRKVQAKVGNEDIGGYVHEVGLGPLPSTNISDVVESDVEEILLIPPDEDID
jgi:hypothetical protein